MGGRVRGLGQESIPGQWIVDTPTFSTVRPSDMIRTMKGISRAGFGFAIAGVGVTILFGAPVGMMAFYPWWEATGYVLVAAGLTLLILGLVKISLSARKLDARRRTEINLRQQEWRNEILEAQGLLPKLRHWHSVATAYDDGIRSAELDAQIQVQLGRIESAQRQLDLEGL